MPHQNRRERAIQGNVLQRGITCTAESFVVAKTAEKWAGPPA